MTKSLSLTIGERLAAVKILNEFKGNMSDLAGLLDDVKKFVVTEEEWAAANLVKTPNGDGTETYKWDDVAEKTIEIADATGVYIGKKINEKSEAGELTMQDRSSMTLADKLK